MNHQAQKQFKRKGFSVVMPVRIRDRVFGCAAFRHVGNFLLIRTRQLWQVSGWLTEDQEHYILLVFYLSSLTNAKFFQVSKFIWEPCSAVAEYLLRLRDLRVHVNSLVSLLFIMLFVQQFLIWRGFNFCTSLQRNLANMWGREKWDERATE